MSAQTPRRATAAGAPFHIVEATIPEMRAAMASGRLTSRELVQQYLDALGTVRGSAARRNRGQPARARGSRRARSRTRAAGRCAARCTAFRSRSKDNIHTTDMPTTGGALAFAGYVPPYEATLTKNLRDAGAIIIAKTGMTELANWVAGAPNADAWQLQRRRRLRLQPVRSAARSARGDLRRPAGAADRRIELRHRHGRELLGGQRRHRHRRIGPQPVERRTCSSASSRPSDASAGTA